MKRPRNATLAEALYYNIENNDYLQEIYDNLLYNYSVRLLSADLPLREVKVSDAARFADILSKCAYSPVTKNASSGDRKSLFFSVLYILMIQGIRSALFFLPLGTTEGLKHPQLRSTQTLMCLTGFSMNMIKNSIRFQELKMSFSSVIKKRFLTDFPEDFSAIPVPRQWASLLLFRHI